jgi:hypothetical protein
MYKLSALNYANALTCKEQDTDTLQYAKTSLQMQVLLRLKQLNLQIKLEVAIDILVNVLKLVINLDLVNSLLQTN